MCTNHEKADLMREKRGQEVAKALVQQGQARPCSRSEVTATGIVPRVYDGIGRPASSHASRDRAVTSAMRSGTVGGHGAALASGLRSGTTRAVMSRR